METTTTKIFTNEEILFSILDYCDNTTRIIFYTKLMNNAIYDILSSNAAYKWRCECLFRENGIYYPFLFCDNYDEKNKMGGGLSWKFIFEKNWSRRYLWNDNDSNNDNGVKKEEGYEESSFHIQVSARFKPMNIKSSSSNNNNNNVKKIVLPLHQRVALIQMNRRLKSKKEAFQVLSQQGDWFAGNNKNDDDDDDDTMEEKKNKNNGDNNPSHQIRGGVHLIDSERNFAVLVDRTKGLRRFDFDHVIGEQMTQEDVYSKTTMPLISDFMNGYNVSCIVYGQTGSGKTHTMFGVSNFYIQRDLDDFIQQSRSSLSSTNNDNDRINHSIPESWGIIPRACYEIFHAIECRKPTLPSSFSQASFLSSRDKMKISIHTDVAISYIEIYGDTVTDLLRNGQSCGQSKVSAQRYVLDGSSEMKVHTLRETMSFLNEGEKCKRKAATAMNDKSSRAHSIFIITLKQTCLESAVVVTSRLFLADLGGSEQLKKSQPFKTQPTTNRTKCGEDEEDGDNEDDDDEEEEQEQMELQRKQRVCEAVNINLGLLALKKCVEALRKKHYVPYKDSKLTMMLSPGIGDDSKTSIIVCGSQEECHGSETIDAMKFGQTCRGIYNTIYELSSSTNNMLQQLLSNINEKIESCENNIRLHERWVTQNVNHYDEDGKFIEVRQVSKIVGAEKYRDELWTLLRKKMELTGDKIDIPHRMNMDMNAM